MRERGLKFSDAGAAGGGDGSLPMRERGLKLRGSGADGAPQPVAPHAGAWIEITRSASATGHGSRRSPCGSVD